MNAYTHDKIAEDELLEFTLKNNYLFLALMNTDEHALRLLVCSTLNLASEDVADITILNPIEVGKAVTDKTFILGLAIQLTDGTLVNIELQVANEGNWPERSLGYLCRSYDNLNHGDDYLDTRPAVHISILDFTLFPGYPEFFASYRILNVKNHNEYTSKFQLYVLDLTKVTLATQENLDNHLDIWAQLFQAKTRSDLMAVTQKCSEFEPIVNNMNTLMSDEAIRLQCQARERVEAHKRGIQKKINRLEGQLAEKNEQLKENAAQLAENASKITEQATLIEELQKKLTMLEN